MSKTFFGMGFAFNFCRNNGSTFAILIVNLFGVNWVFFARRTVEVYPSSLVKLK